MSKLSIPLETGATSALVYEAGADSIGATLVLAHGAGAGQQSSFLVDFARALSRLGLDVVTFNFPYIEQRRKIPDRGPVLEACYRAAIAAVRDRVPSARRALFIGGKSMGGRIATQVAAADAALSIAGLVLLGYPLHPPGKPTERRDKHLPSVARPMLFVQGTRDAFGTPTELAPVLDPLASAVTVHVVSGGDHSFKVPRADATSRASRTEREGSSRASQSEVFAEIQQTIVTWVRGIIGATPPSPRT